MDDESHTTCLSPDCHDDNIKDHLSHFLGCIEISERHYFLFDPEYKLWKQQTKYWITKLQQAEDTDEKRTDHDIERQAMKKCQTTREAWRDDCLGELRRIDFLRFQFKVDPHWQEKLLVDNVEKSRDAWKKSLEFEENIDRVKAWGASRRKYTWKAYEDPIDESAYKPYESGRDVNVHFMQFEKVNPSDPVFTPVDESPAMRQAIWDTFPNQKTTVHRLLHPDEGQKNLLSKDEDKNMLKYFHIPSNNMMVSTLVPFLLSCRITTLSFSSGSLTRQVIPPLYVFLARYGSSQWYLGIVEPSPPRKKRGGGGRKGRDGNQMLIDLKY